MAMTLEPCPFKKWTANMYDDAADRLEDLVGTVAAATQVEMLRDAAKMVRAHLTQPVQPCPHIVSADEGTSYCSLAESAKPAQAVDVGAIREVIADMDCDTDMPVTADAWRDKLTRAIGTAQEWPAVNERCQQVMRKRGKPYPRTCYVCGLRGPCVTSEAQLSVLPTPPTDGEE